jgi:predicted alpha/beta-hydrolase family hydrolase
MTATTDHQGAGREATVRIRLRPFVLDGVLTIPAGALGLVLFAHSRGKSRPDRRTDAVARALNRAAIGTGLFDLLTDDEERGGGASSRARMDLDLVAGRLGVATDWVRAEPLTDCLRVGYFGADAGAVAALVAAGDRTGDVYAVVVAGKRPDLAGAALASVRAPTLLVASQRDEAAREFNSRAHAAMRSSEKRLEVVPLPLRSVRMRVPVDRLAELSVEWFARFLIDGTTVH